MLQIHILSDTWYCQSDVFMLIKQMVVKHYFIKITIYISWGSPDGSDGKESTCNAGDLGSIPGSRLFPVEGDGYSGILAWRILWTEELDGLQFMELQRVKHDWATSTSSPSLYFLISVDVKYYFIFLLAIYSFYLLWNACLYLLTVFCWNVWVEPTKTEHSKIFFQCVVHKKQLFWYNFHKHSFQCFIFKKKINQPKKLFPEILMVSWLLT